MKGIKPTSYLNNMIIYTDLSQPGGKGRACCLAELCWAGLRWPCLREERAASWRPHPPLCLRPGFGAAGPPAPAFWPLCAMCGFRSPQSYHP